MTLAIVLILVTLSGIFSGLNLGLLSLDKYELARKAKLGNRYAKKILPIRKNGNLLLSSLLIGNVIVNSVLSVFLADLTTGLIGVIVSTSLIVIFGEIIPQSVFSRYALKLGAFMTPFTKLLLIILFPLAGPIAYVMNKVMGDELPEVWSKEELRDIVSTLEKSPKSKIDSVDSRIIEGVLLFSDKKAKDIMTPKRLVFCVNEDAEINDIFYEKVDKHQFTRIPVYRGRKDRVVGILYLKDLLTIEDEEVLKVSDITRTNSHIRVDDDETLDDILSLFLSKKVKIAMVYSGKEFLGVITLEDLLEEILQEELYDEMDQTSKARKTNYRKMERE